MHPRLEVLFVLTCFATAVTAAEPLSIEKRVEALTQKLQTGAPVQRAKAAAHLGDLGPFAKSAVRKLLAATGEKNTALRYEAVVALGRIGDSSRQTVKTLAGLLDDPATLIRHAAITSLRQIGSADEAALKKLKRLLTAKDELLRVNAAWTLVVLKPDDKLVINATLAVFLKALGSKPQNVRSDALAAVVGVGRPAVPALRKLLREESPPACIGAADALAGIGHDAKASVPDLLRRLSDRDGRICWHSARALGAIGASPESVVPVLRGLLSHKSTSVRGSAATALGRFAANAASAVPKLAVLLKDERVNVRLNAARALGKIGPKAASAVPALNRALDDPVGAVTLNAAEALGRIGAPAVPALVKRLGDRHLRTLIASILAEIGPDAKSAIPELLKMARDKDRAARIEAVLALAAMGSAARSAVPELIRFLKSPKAEGRGGAVYALVKIGAADIVPILERTVKDPDDEMLRMVSAWGLVSLRPGNPRVAKLALSHLIKGLSHDHPVARREAVMALGKLGNRAAPSVPKLISLLDTPDPLLRAEILHSLGQVGPKARPAIVSAVKSLHHPDPQVRAAGAYFLGKMGRSSLPAVSQLRRMLNSRVSYEQTIAAWALVQIDPRPKFVRVAVPKLIATLDHNDPDARLEAARTLGRIGKGRPHVVNALRKCAKDPDPKVRKAVQAALLKLKSSN